MALGIRILNHVYSTKVWHAVQHHLIGTSYSLASVDFDHYISFVEALLSNEVVFLKPLINPILR